MKVIPVKNLGSVDVTRYVEGTLFLTDQKIAILHKGKLDPLVKQSDLRLFVKKKDVAKMIDDALKKEGDNV